MQIFYIFISRPHSTLRRPRHLRPFYHLNSLTQKCVPPNAFFLNPCIIQKKAVILQPQVAKVIDYVTENVLENRVFRFVRERFRAQISIESAVSAQLPAEV